MYFIWYLQHWKYTIFLKDNDKNNDCDVKYITTYSDNFTTKSQMIGIA